MAYPSFSDISKSFAPGWFAAVMGTGVLALTTHSLAQGWPALGVPAVILHWLNTALFLALAAWVAVNGVSVSTTPPAPAPAPATPAGMAVR